MCNLSNIERFKFNLKEDYDEGDLLMHLCVRELINLMRNKELVVEEVVNIIKSEFLVKFEENDLYDELRYFTGLYEEEVIIGYWDYLISSNLDDEVKRLILDLESKIISEEIRDDLDMDSRSDFFEGDVDGDLYLLLRNIIFKMAFGKSPSDWSHVYRDSFENFMFKSLSDDDIVDLYKDRFKKYAMYCANLGCFNFVLYNLSLVHKDLEKSEELCNRAIKELKDELKDLDVDTMIDTLELDDNPGMSNAIHLCTVGSLVGSEMAVDLAYLVLASYIKQISK